MKKILITTLALLAATAASAAETGTALKNDSLMAEPYSDARPVGSLTRGDKLDILEKKGAWLKIKTAKNSGWVRLLSVKRGTLGKSNDAAGVLGLATGRSGTGQVVSTTGVRGLSEEDLKAAKFSEDEIRKLEGNGISGAEAQQFAAAGSLKPRKLDYLPAPATQGGVQ
ncbi:MAG TPA: SH3 domain-containing protein [Novimethylophilus sp.]|jgi:hypothetical protein|uniref:SH3 domain-containing protein n=1 Tax=Novimethylophilus sp. TaxID=2137426 RepID=UPI002F4295E4